MHLFINQRLIAARGEVASTLLACYDMRLMRGEYPYAVLLLQIDPASVDVNIHPQKQEVRFRDTERVRRCLGAAVREALAASTSTTYQSSVPTPTPAPPAPAATSSAPPPHQQRLDWKSASSSTSNPGSTWPVNRQAWQPDSRWDSGQSPRPPYQRERVPGDELFPEQEAAAPIPGESAAEPLYPRLPPVSSALREQTSDAVYMAHQEEMQQYNKLPRLRVIGQVGLTYMVTESPEGVYFVDIHAAAERITYERLRRQHRAGSLESQLLLTPEVVTLPHASTAALLEHTEQLAAWGFALEEWGAGLLRVRAIPATLALEELQAALLAIAGQLQGEAGGTPADWHEQALITLACHTSVRAGQALTLTELRGLLTQLDACEEPRTCPHGRPLLVHIPVDELEQRFGRRA
ncbi:MAG: hypothetical protein HC876_12400 [Chloroflexaceae bacterium]|nr:hypothetical protein [Chloroflexaceae bacterium]